MRWHRAAWGVMCVWASIAQAQTPAPAPEMDAAVEETSPLPDAADEALEMTADSSNHASGAAAAPSSDDDTKQAWPDTGYHSMLFTTAEIERLKEARRAYWVTQQQLAAARAAGADQKDLVATMGGGAGEVRFLEYPQFYLSSIVFHAAEGWTVWLNGMKFTPDALSSQGVTLQQVTREAATFTWTPASFRLYADRLPPESAASVQLDVSAGSITFTLFPNQAFSSHTMRITEGYLPSVYVERIGDALAPAATPPKP